LDQRSFVKALCERIKCVQTNEAKPKHLMSAQQNVLSERFISSTDTCSVSKALTEKTLTCGGTEQVTVDSHAVSVSLCAGPFCLRVGLMWCRPCASICNVWLLNNLRQLMSAQQILAQHALGSRSKAYARPQVVSRMKHGGRICFSQAPAATVCACVFARVSHLLFSPRPEETHGALHTLDSSSTKPPLAFPRQTSQFVG